MGYQSQLCGGSGLRRDGMMVLIAMGAREGESITIRDEDSKELCRMMHRCSIAALLHC